MAQVDAILAESHPVSTPPNRSSGLPKVTFCESANIVHNPADDIITPSNDGDTNNMNDLWYTKDELVDMANVIRLAYLAVNDACGDLDVANTVQIHRTKVLNSRPAQMAETSKSLSDFSSRLARLHALLLEKDLVTLSGVPIPYDTLRSIVQNLMPQEDEEDETVHEAESIGTIDLLEQEQVHSWDIDDLFSDTIDTSSNLDSGKPRDEKRNRSIEFDSSKTEIPPYSLSTSWRDETPNDIASCNDSMQEKQQATITTTISTNVMTTRRGSIPCDGGSMDEPNKLMSKSSTSTDPVSCHQHVGTKPWSLRSVASNPKLPDDKHPMPSPKSTVAKSRNMVTAWKAFSILKKRPHSSGGGSEESTLKDKDHVDCCGGPPNSKRSRVLTSDVPMAEGNASIQGEQSPTAKQESDDDETAVLIPPIKDSHDDGQVANAMIALARWEFRAHLLPIR